jgi:uncharacterized protein (DUF2336 family)
MVRPRFRDAAVETLVGIDGGLISNVVIMPSAALSSDDPRNTENSCTEKGSLIDELNNAVAARNAKQRQRILERLTDLFAAGSRGYSSDQIALFHDVLRELSADIEVKARARLARRLACIDRAPPRLIRSLAFDDEIEVAEAVLVHSQQLCDADLVENASIKNQEHLFAIAQRLKLSEPVTDVLVERGNRRVVHQVVKNRGARFSLAGYDKLTARARSHRKLTLALGQRSDLPRQYFLKLLETASASVRAELERANPHAAAEVRDTIDDVANGVQREVRAGSRRYAVALRDVNRCFNASPLTEASIHAPERGQEFERTVIALAKIGRLPVDLVERALLDKGEDMILILAKAGGCSWTTVKELLLMRVAERKLQPDDLVRAFDRYKKLTQATARNILRFYEQRVERRAQSRTTPVIPVQEEVRTIVSR